MCTADNLLKQIETMRNKMSIVAFDKGFSSKESVAVSQELDRLLNIYDTVKDKKK